MATIPGTVSGRAPALLRSDLGLPGRREGKVRDIYALPPEPGEAPRLLIVATDRISAFDVVLPTPIPGKGKLLSEISVKWFQFIRSLRIAADHLLSADARRIPGLDDRTRASVEGRVMIVRAAEVVPVEFVVRGYLAGSGWQQYRRDGTVCGVKLPAGMRNGDRLPEPIFTPTTKATAGHDEPLSFEDACRIATRSAVERGRDIARAVYEAGARYAAERGIILADTKFEFGRALDKSGRPGSELMLIDEVLTPDSSRYWPADRWAPGREQENFDKQYVRNYLQELTDAGAWDKTSPGPELPAEVVENTLARYVEVRNRLFG